MQDTTDKTLIDEMRVRFVHGSLLLWKKSAPHDTFYSGRLDMTIGQDKVVFGTIWQSYKEYL